jgi:creatinine amidohydrolase/Fe(II)-dependent formamide hydrolase-like protein
MISLFDQSHTEARRLAKTGATVFLTVNPVEFHGPHLSLHNDRLISLGLARDLHDRLEPDLPFLVGADLEVGVDPCPGPGSRHVPYSVVRCLVVEACRALVELGVKRVVLMTFHGAPLHAHAIEAGVRELRRHGVRAISPFNLLAYELLEADAAKYTQILAPVEDLEERARLAEDFAHDFHAGFGETSMTLHYAPESVSPDYTKLPPCPKVAPPRSVLTLANLAAKMGNTRLAGELGFAASGMGWYALRPFPGYTGRPHSANAKSGKAFAEVMVDRFAECACEVFAGRATSPEPIMQWVMLATLGGRVGALSIPASEVRRLATS